MPGHAAVLADKLKGKKKKGRKKRALELTSEVQNASTLLVLSDCSLRGSHQDPTASSTLLSRSP